MDEAAIRALFASMLEEQLSPAIEGVLHTLQGHVDSELTRVRGELTSQNSQANQPAQPTQDNQRLKELESMVEQLQADRKAFEEKLEASDRARRFDASFDAALSQYKVLPEVRDFLVQSLKGSLSDIKEVKGNFVTKDGKPLSDYVANFMKSETGKHFLAYDGLADGTGGRSTSDKPGVAPTNDMQAVLEAFM
jgi:hypothetical protein